MLGITKRSRNTAGLTSAEYLDSIQLKRIKLAAALNTSKQRTVTFPDKDGTVAMLTDITALPNNLVTTDSTQAITGKKTFGTIVVQAPSYPAKTTTIYAADMNFNLGCSLPNTYTIDTFGEVFVLQNVPQSLFNKTLNGSVLTGGFKVGTTGSTTTNEVRGTIPYSTALAAGAFVSIGYVNFTNGITFASIPSVIVSMTNNSGGNYWDQCQVAISQLSTTQLNVAIRNNSTNSTNGSATINYIAWI